MTGIILILTVGIILLSISQVITVRVFLKHLEVIPKSEPRVASSEDVVNDFGGTNYMDISDVTPEDGIKALTGK